MALSNNASICIVTFITSNLLVPGPISWGPEAVAINRAYAEAYGYQYHLYQNSLQPPGSPINWSPPMAAERVMRDHPDCEIVLSLDGDAVVNNFDISLEGLEERNMPDNVDMLLTCHKHQKTVSGNCFKCKCTWENAGGCNFMEEYEKDSDCGVNMGVFLVRTRNQGPELLNWWTTAGHGNCSWKSGNRIERKWNLQAQVCSNKLKNQYPQRIRVANARVMNMPSFYDPKTNQAKFKQFGSYKYNSRCFSSKVFVCHALGVRGGQGRDRKKMFAMHLNKYVIPWSIKRVEARE